MQHQKIQTMNRYKPTGWRYESHRHSLAAKGITTRYYSKAFLVGVRAKKRGWKVVSLKDEKYKTMPVFMITDEKSSKFMTYIHPGDVEYKRIYDEYSKEHEERLPRITELRDKRRDEKFEKERLERENESDEQKYARFMREYVKYHEEEGEKKNYMAYIGFVPADVEKMENFFEKNPRLKLIRDKSVKDIANVGIPKGAVATFYGKRTQKGDNASRIDVDMFKLSGDAELEVVMRHELTHAAQSAKLGDNFHESYKKVSKDIGTRYAVLPSDEEILMKRHNVDPIEKHALLSEGTVENNRVSKHTVELLDEGKRLEKYVPRLKRVRTEYEGSLKETPNLRDKPDVWVK